MTIIFTLPGTKIETRENTCRDVLSSLFETEGLVLSQVCSITGLETHTVQNWVKRGFVSSPKGKKYTKRQFCRIVIINMLKEVLHIEHVTKLLSCLNGVLHDETDDLIDDSELYCYFIDLIFETNGNFSAVDGSIIKVLMEYKETEKGARVRLENVLRVMITAYLSAELKKKAMLYYTQLDNTARGELK